MKTKKIKMSSEGAKNNIAVKKLLMARQRWLRSWLAVRADAG
jgi:hypothetical protein